MDVSKKVYGCNEMLKSATGLDDKAASRFNYVMSIESAANYAKMHPEPAIIPIFIPDWIPIERDPEGCNSDEFRTRATISRYCILKNKDVMSSKRRDFLLKALGTHLSHKDEAILIEKIQFHISKTLKRVPQYLEKAEDFKASEAERHQQTIQAMEAAGIDLDLLKPGESISVDLGF